MICIHFDDSNYCPRCQKNRALQAQTIWIEPKNKEPKRDIFTNYWTKSNRIIRHTKPSQLPLL